MAKLNPNLNDAMMRAAFDRMIDRLVERTIRICDSYRKRPTKRPPKLARTA